MGMSLRDTDAHPTWPPDRTHGMCARVSSTNCINVLRALVTQLMVFWFVSAKDVIAHVVVRTSAQRLA